MLSISQKSFTWIKRFNLDSSTTREKYYHYLYFQSEEMSGIERLSNYTKISYPMNDEIAVHLIYKDSSKKKNRLIYTSAFSFLLVFKK